MNSNLEMSANDSLNVTAELPARGGSDQPGEAIEDRFEWAIIRPGIGLRSSSIIRAGSVPYDDFRQTLHSFWKWSRIIRDQQAMIAGDKSAQVLLKLLDERTSVRWADLSRESGLPWEDVARGLTILASAQACEAGPLRVRIVESQDQSYLDLPLNEG